MAANATATAPAAEQATDAALLYRMRHSTAHVMAQAVQRLFPGTKFGIGPAIEDGFYYDFDSPHQFSPEDFPAIEAEMGKVVAADYPFVESEVAREEARRAGWTIRSGTPRPATDLRSAASALSGPAVSA